MPCVDAHVTDLAAADVLEIRPRAEAQPLALLVVMVREPVHEALVLDYAEEPRLPVMAEIVAREREVPRAPREQADLVAAHGGVDDAHVASTIDPDSDTARLIGIGRGIEADERRTGEVDREVVAANRDDGRVERRRRDQAVGSRRDAHRLRDHEPGTQLDRWCRFLPARAGSRGGEHSAGEHDPRVHLR